MGQHRIAIKQTTARINLFVVIVIYVMKYRNPGQVLDALRIMANLLEDEKPWSSKSKDAWEHVASLINVCESFTKRQLNYNSMKKLDDWLVYSSNLNMC
jgi:hypothetical protein